jgi:hypothetical protein
MECEPRVVPKLRLTPTIAISREGQMGIMLHVANWTTLDQLVARVPYFRNGSVVKPWSTQVGAEELLPKSHREVRGLMRRKTIDLRDGVDQPLT